MKITDLRFVDSDPSYKGAGSGYWRATVYVPDPPAGHTREVDTKHGSWQTVPRNADELRAFVMPEVAAALQREVHKMERRLGMHELVVDRGVMSSG